MSRFITRTQETAQNFSIDDAVGIAEVLIGLFKECREKRNQGPAQIKESLRSRPFLAKISLRREFARRGFNRQEARQLSDEAVQIALQESDVFDDFVETSEEVM